MGWKKSPDSFSLAPVNLFANSCLPSKTSHVIMRRLYRLKCSSSLFCIPAFSSAPPHPTECKNLSRLELAMLVSFPFPCYYYYPNETGCGGLQTVLALRHFGIGLLYSCIPEQNTSGTAGEIKRLLFRMCVFDLKMGRV